MKQAWVVAFLALISPALAQDKPSGYLGVMVAPLDAASRAAHSIPDGVTRGVVLSEVFKDTAAARAGLRAGDVLTSFAGNAVNTPDELGAAVRAHPPGAHVRYTARRGTGMIEGTLTLGKRPAAGPGLEIEPPKPAKPTGKPRPMPPGGLDRRLDTVEKDLETMYRRVMERRRRARKQTQPAGLGLWIAREKEFAAAARERGDERAIRHHEARMGLLKELTEAGVHTPPPGRQMNRLARVERKLDRILELLETRE